MSVQERTYMPTRVNQTLIEILEKVTVMSDDCHPLYLTVGENEDVVELPDELSSMLRLAIEAMQEGLAVTIRPESQQLTTTEVADLLGVTRPTVVKLLESGAIPYTQVGTHRRVSLHDALQYRDARRERQYTFLANTQTEDEPPRDQVLADLKRIRTELGTRSRQATHA